jgi:hypothetical protein
MKRPSEALPLRPTIVACSVGLWVIAIPTCKDNAKILYSATSRWAGDIAGDIGGDIGGDTGGDIAGDIGGDIGGVYSLHFA